MQQLTEIQYKIINQISIAVQGLGGNSDILSILGSWGETLDDDFILKLLEYYNKGEL